MPLYDYKCHSCLARQEVILRLSELGSAVVHCLKCNTPMNRQLSAPHIVGDYPGYSCPITGKWIEGRRAHIENLKQHGCRVLEPGEREGAIRFRKEQDEKLDKAVEETYEELVAKMPTEKRDKLAAEMEAGVDVEVVRAAPAQ